MPWYYLQWTVSSANAQLLVILQTQFSHYAKTHNFKFQEPLFVFQISHKFAKKISNELALVELEIKLYNTYITAHFSKMFKQLGKR